MNLDAGRRSSVRSSGSPRTQRVVDLDTRGRPRSRGPGPTRPGVALTFDDGTADWVEVVAPILGRHRVPGHLLPDDRLPRGRPPAARRRAGDLVGGSRASSPRPAWRRSARHTHSHRLLDRLDPAGDRRRARPEHRPHRRATSGCRAHHFAYPKAVDPSPPAHDAPSGARFRPRRSPAPARTSPGGDPLRLQRSPVQAADSFADFRRKARGGMGFEDTVRRTTEPGPLPRAAS